MICEYCGFVSSKDFHRCPYCDTETNVHNDILERSIRIGNLFTIQVRTLVLAIVANILLFAVFVDAWTQFRYCISYWLMVLLGSGYVLTSAITSQRSLIATAERIDVCILFGLCIGTFAFKFEPFFNFGRYMPTIVIPIFSTLGSIFSFALVFVKRKKKFRPLWTEILLIAHLVVMVIIFVFFHIAKYGSWKELTDYFLLPGGWGIVQEIFVYLGSAFASVYIVNYNLVVFGHIIKQVSVRYGGEKRNS